MADNNIQIPQKPKSLNELAEPIKLDPEDILNIVTNEIASTVQESFISILPGGEAINKVLAYGSKIEEKVNEKKKETLIASYLEKTDSMEEALEKLKRFISDPYGALLFNRIIRILTAKSLVPEFDKYIKNLAGAIDHIITEGDFFKHFESHTYILDQIEQLTVQELIILGDFINWPIFILMSPNEVTSGIVTSSWTNEFTNAYIQQKIEVLQYNQAQKYLITTRIRNTIHAMQRNNLIVCQALDITGNISMNSIQEDKMRAKCILTDTGELLEPYTNAKAHQ